MLLVDPRYQFSKAMNYNDKNKIKERALEHIVCSIIELEENKNISYRVEFRDNEIHFSKIAYSQSFRIVITEDYMTIIWLSDTVVMNRAKSEEEYFQMMCLDDTYCDEVFEEGIKQLIDLHVQRLLKNSAIGGFREGAYDQSDSE